ncbi:hypothetical protein CCP1ISM_3190001 [Azospirillaceae bacterium]
MSEMEISKPVPMFERIIDSVLAQKTELSNWELDFVATICRIGASGKIVKLTEGQTSSLISLYFRHVLINKCNKMIDVSDFKCDNGCNNGFLEDQTGSSRCPKCNGNGYLKISKVK